MKLMTSWHVQGFAEGHAEGFAEGRAEEALIIVNRQLKRKLGPLGPDLRQHIDGLPVERLEALAEALLDFNSTADLTAWLDAPVAEQ